MASAPPGQADPPTGPGADHPRPARRPRNLRTYFLTGVLVAAPISITIWITWAIVSFVDQRVTPLLARLFPDPADAEAFLPLTIPGVGIVVVVGVLILLGALTTNLVGRSVVTFGERLVDRVPVVRSIYSLFKQIFQTILAQGRGTFTKVGLIQHPRPGLWSVVFIASQVKGEISEHVEDEVVSVFLPTIPNPTTGFLIFVPRREIIILDMTVEEAAKLVLSAGLVVPQRDGHSVDPDATLEEFLRRQKPGAEPPRVPESADLPSRSGDT